MPHLSEVSFPNGMVFIDVGRAGFEAALEGGAGRATHLPFLAVR